MLKQSELKDLLAERLEVSKSQAEAFIKTFNQILIEDLLATGKTKLQDIGTLEVRYRASREGVNPKTNEPLNIPESLTVGLSASSVIKRRLKDEVEIANYRK